MSTVNSSVALLDLLIYLTVSLYIFLSSIYIHLRQSRQSQKQNIAALSFSQSFISSVVEILIKEGERKLSKLRI